LLLSIPNKNIIFLKNEKLLLRWVLLRSEIFKDLADDLKRYMDEFMVEKILILDIYKLNDFDLEAAFLKHIIRTLRDQRILYVVYENQKYYERSNIYYQRDDDIKTLEHDPDKPCNDYYNEIDGPCAPDILPNNVDLVSYFFDDYIELKFADYNDVDDIIWTYGDLLAQQMKINKLNMKQLKINFGNEFQQIIFENCSGYNFDHRGANHCKIQLAQYAKFIHHCCQDNLSLYDLCDIYHKLKSHKFDYWYELFCDAKIECDQQLKILTIKLHFDHGS